MNNNIHDTAIIEDSVTLGANVSIGPYCHVSGNVTLGDHVTLHAHVVVTGNTTIGEHTTIFPFASIGTAPQDLKFKGEASTLEIGHHTIIREHVTMNPGTEGGGMITKVGNHCLFMMGSHVAHDCQVGDHVILANNATLAGHVSVGNHVVIGGLAAIHQFVRIGHHAMVGGLSGVENDIIPYGSVMGERANLGGLNITGLKRRGFERETIHGLRSAYRMLFAEEGTLQERLEDVLEHFKDHEHVMEIIQFMQTDSSRAFCQPKNANKAV